MTVALAVSMPALYLLQSRAGWSDAVLALAFQPATLREGGWWPGLLTSMFLHAGWPHAAMNAAGAIAFGPPVARLLPGARGALAFLLFYTLCGLAGSLGFGLVRIETHSFTVGASGAVFGLMGAAIRLLGRRNGRLRPLGDRRVLTISAVLMVVNVGAGLIGVAPGMEGTGIAWEAHAFGYLFGLLAIGPWVRLWAPAAQPFDSAGDLRDPPA